ncbi:MAG: hypothetical protein LBS36_06860 [Oscillospiraceae bacterium]|jgi:hypothetical protein|nr:hypothetical protein [Oscillospiraceae bacterium]
MNILEELYFGNIRPCDKCFDKQSRYGAFINIIAENEETLLDYFKTQQHETQQHLFSQLMNAQEEILAFSEQNRFIEGFQTGAKLMLDTFILPQSSVIRDIC